MPLNIPGFLAPFQLLFRPYLVVPSLVVRDLRCLDFQALHRAGYRGAVFDKDNCLTLPYEDTLVSDLREAWEECKRVFGSENLLVVSNSAGTRLDPGGIEAESVSYHLGVPVLRHDTMKPGYACIRAIRAYFASLPNPVPDAALFVVGDRVFTDVVMANRMWPYTRRHGKTTFPQTREEKDDTDQNSQDSQNWNDGAGPLSIFTEQVWKKDSIAIRYLEKRLIDLVRGRNIVGDENFRRKFIRT